MLLKKLSTVNHAPTLTAGLPNNIVTVTYHWKDNISLERHSAAMACQTFKGSHTFDVFAAAREETHCGINIREKLTRTTTDRAFPQRFSMIW